MKAKDIIQMTGMIAIAIIGIAAALDGLKVDTTVLLIGAILMIAAPEVLKEVGFGPFGGN